MSSDCFHPNPLVHGGSSQELRMVPALDPAKAPVDARTMDELILFLEKYAGLLNYYDTSNTISGHWEPFLSEDLSTILASVSVSRYDRCLDVYYKYYEKIQNENIASQLKNYLKVLFDISFTLLDNVRRWNERLVLKTPAKEMFYQEITGGLAYYLRDLLLYYQASQPTFINTSFVLLPGAEDYLPNDSESILVNTFQQEWWAKYNSADVINSWSNYKTAYLPPHLIDVNIFGDPGWSVNDKIRYSSSFLKSSFTNIYNAYTRIIKAAAQYFIASVNNYPYHKAHNGLVLAFLKLFGIAQKELNRLTDRHLNFYYKDVLRINRRPPIPDSAHLVFTLAKNVHPYTLDEGAELIGGKDKIGKELIYKTDDTITVNKSEIAGLKSIFIDDDPLAGGIFAAEISNSADGKGKDLPPADPSWFAFGSEQAKLIETARSMNETEAGFIIASPILQLSEGERIVTINISIGNFGGASFGSSELCGKIDVALTGKKGWILLPDITTDDTTQPSAVKINTSTNTITIRFTLDEALQSVIPFDPAIHESTYASNLPMFRCLLKKTAATSLYRKLSGVVIDNINIEVTVNNAVICILHNDQGGLDPKNPFMPFGPRPKKNSNLFFGSYEVFSKHLNSLTMNLKWMGTPVGVSFYDHYAFKKPDASKSKSTNAGEANYINIPDSSAKSFTIACKIKDGDEFNCSPADPTLFASGNNASINTTQALVFSSLLAQSDPLMDNFIAYDPLLRRGFLRITLTGPDKAFGHDVFSKVFTEQVIAVNGDDAASNSLPNEPYTPLLQPLNYSYTASEQIQVGAANNKIKGQFFHLFPFGHAEKNAGAGINLIPPFIHTDKTGAVQSLQGALHIGIKNIEPYQLLNLYIEFSEGSEDASIDPPGILWSYMSANQWLLLDHEIIADSTNGFLGSGIVKIMIPDGMNNDNTAMPAGMKWIRIGITGSYLAYPKVYAVFTNAVKAIFDDRSNETSHLASPLKAGSIAKLVDSIAEIKKVEQPYDSFDGQMQEGDKAYYTRVSERLRHKHRAITIWDYERIILEQYKFLYKAKCLNHTNDVTETAPGCVRVIVIPDMSAKSSGNLFEPKVSNNNRKKIKDHITKLNCPFADLQVQNPQYEAIKVKCEVKIREGLDVIAHIDKLKKDVSKFLAPWAFDESRGIDFGGSLHRSQIIYFMEKLPYVDFVTDFVMDLYIAGVIVKTNIDEVKATTSKSILTSFNDHQIGTNVCAS